jgi:DNA mismatch repair protein MutL
LYDLGSELGLVDQHAAHERVRYEKLRARSLRGGDSSTQSLLIPEAVRFDGENRLTLESRLPLLEKLGFETELFGDDTLLFRGIPAEWGQDELRIRLKGLTERLISVDVDSKSDVLALDESLFERLASEACHSAIRAGDRLETIEATTLLSELFLCEHPWNCPHGRPTVVRIPRARFEEWFQRRV